MLAFLLSCAVAAHLAVPWWKVAQVHELVQNADQPGKAGEVEEEICEYLRLWFCPVCGGRWEEADLHSCPHCGMPAQGSPGERGGLL
jgi:hypothetical protein